MELGLIDFTQVPLCNYTTYWTVSMYPKPLGPEDRDIPYELKRDGEVYGEPQLVTVDTSQWKILIDAKDITATPSLAFYR